jgi:hypothetical protein
MGERTGIYRVLVGKPGVKRPVERPRRRWEDNIKTDHQELGWRGMNRIELAQDRDRWQALTNTAMKNVGSTKYENFLNSSKPVSFPRRNLPPWNK